MGFLIGGLSPKQYDAYLSTNSRTQVEKPKGVMAFLGLSSGCAALAVFINRLAYFIFNCAYPNDTYLFNKFKSHQFTEMKTTDQYQVAREIFKRFQKCPELGKEDVAKVKTDLKNVKHQLYPKPADKPIEPAIVENVEKNQEDAVEGKENQIGAKDPSVEDNIEDNVEKNEEGVEHSDSNASVEGNKDKDIENKEKEFEEIEFEKELDEDDLKELDEDNLLEEDVPVDGAKADTTTDVEGHAEEGVKEEGKEDELKKAAENLARLDQKVEQPPVDVADEEIEKEVDPDNKKDSAGAGVDAGVKEEGHEEPIEEQPKVGEGAGDIEKVDEDVVDIEIEPEKEVEAEKKEVELLSPHIEAVKLYMQEEAAADQLLRATKELQNQLSTSSISTVFGRCQVAEQQHENEQTEKNSAGWFGLKGQVIRMSPQKVQKWTNPISPFDYTKYAVAHGDLDVLIEVATSLLKYSVKARHFLNDQQKQGFDLSFVAVQKELIKFCNWLELVNGTVQEVNYSSKKQQLNTIITALKEEISVVIGQDTGGKPYPKWKIKRYEDLITGTQANISKYFEAFHLDVEILALKSLETQAKDWLVQLKPILLFCRQDIRRDENRFNDQYIKEITTTYLAFIEELRKAEEWARMNPKQEGVEHIHAICYQFYAMLDVNKECQEIVKVVVDAVETPQVIPVKYQFADNSTYNLIRNLYRMHKHIQEAPAEIKSPRLNKLMRTVSEKCVSLDTNTQSNFANCVLTKIISIGENLKYVKELGMGTPIIHNTFGSAAINAEFKGFLHHCEKMGLKHLYVNTLTSLKNNYHAVIQDLEKEFKGIFFMLKFNQDSLFYQQKGHQISSLEIAKVKEQLLKDLTQDDTYIELKPRDAQKKDALSVLLDSILQELHLEEMRRGRQVHFEGDKDKEAFIQRFHNKVREELKDSAKTSMLGKFELNYSIYDSSELFKEKLIAQMFDSSLNETGNYISQDLVNTFNLRTWAVEMARQIHHTMFENKVDLSAEERRVFIRLFYHNLMQKVLLVTDANSYNMSCEKGCDQGAASQAEEFAYLAILNNNANNPEVIRTFEANLFARAVIVNKSSIDESCLERTIETVKFMLEHQEQLKTLHADLFPAVQMGIDQFPFEIKA